MATTESHSLVVTHNLCLLILNSDVFDCKFTQFSLRTKALYQKFAMDGPSPTVSVDDQISPTRKYSSFLPQQLIHVLATRETAGLDLVITSGHEGEGRVKGLLAYCFCAYILAMYANLYLNTQKGEIENSLSSATFLLSGLCVCLILGYCAGPWGLVGVFSLVTELLVLDDSEDGITRL